MMVAYNAAYLGVVWFTPAIVDDHLKKEYSMAQKKQGELARKELLLDHWKNERKPFIESLEFLATTKPADVSFLKLKMNTEIVIDGFGVNASRFNSYAEMITNEKRFFDKAQVDKITATNGVKTFQIKITPKK